MDGPRLMVRSTGDEKMLVPLLKGPGGERIGRVFEKSGDFFEVFFSGVEMPLEREDSKFTAREYARDAAESPEFNRGEARRKQDFTDEMGGCSCSYDGFCGVIKT
jgi:hypothetical protein